MDIQPIIDKICRTLEQHAVPGHPGHFTRFSGHDADEYGCADAANILYTIGQLERENSPARYGHIDALRGCQAPDTGLFTEATHVPLHTTAHCIAALELYDTAPMHPIAALEKYRTPQGITELLESLTWNGVPRLQGHEGAGAFAALWLTGHHERAWQDAYFGWLEDHCDATLGLGFSGMPGHPAPISSHLFDWFHYLFNFHAANRPIPYPERLIDTCIELFWNNGLPDRFDCQCGFWEIDWVFCLHRACRQCGYRFDDCRKALRIHGEKFLAMLDGCSELSEIPRGNDLHLVFGTVCALAELQLALPGELTCDVPLRNVLDRRPFI